MYVPQEMQPAFHYPEHIGEEQECAGCDTVRPFEDGILYSGMVKKNERMHLQYFWFCSFTCILQHTTVASRA